MKKQRLIHLLQAVLGIAKISKNEIAFACPYCSHPKKKFNINLNNYRWHCWVCGIKGVGIHRIFKAVGAGSKIAELNLLTPKQTVETDKLSTICVLPYEFIPMINGNRYSPEYKNAMTYLRNRGLSKVDVLRHNIGYCESGYYAGYIIVPSYDANGILNYFVGRSYYEVAYKHKNPKVSKDIIGFDMLINWKEDINLCEGVFDAFAIGENTIPLFGKFLSPKLKQQINDKKVRRINVILDKDAMKEALRLSEYLLGLDVDVHLIELPNDTDPSDIGLDKMKEIINKSESLDLTKIVEMRFGF